MEIFEKIYFTELLNSIFEGLLFILEKLFFEVKLTRTSSLNNNDVCKIKPSKSIPNRC